MKWNWVYIRDRKIKGTLSKLFGIRFRYPSETSKVRSMVLPYCVGKGCDVGFGGDKVRKTDCDGIDFPQPYAHAGRDKVDIPVDVIHDEIPVPDGHYDYVYTSHLIEDFEDTSDALRKFTRILRDGGALILVFPDQPRYLAHCSRVGIDPNPYHVHADMGYEYMKRTLSSVPGIRFEEVFHSDGEIDYNVIMVLRVWKSSSGPGGVHHAEAQG
jgi:hypothetical protein